MSFSKAGQILKTKQKTNKQKIKKTNKKQNKTKTIQKTNNSLSLHFLIPRVSSPSP